MTLKKGGLLSKRAIKKAGELRNKHRKILRFVHKINAFAENEKSKLIIHKDNPQEILCTCLFMKILEGNQAAILLVERGFDLDVPAILRSTFETLVYLKLSCLDRNFVKEYALSHDAKILELIYKAMRNPSDKLYAELLRNEEKEISIEDVINGIKDSLSMQGIPAENLADLKKFLSKFEKRALAEKAGFLDQYRTFYFETSNYAHTSPKVLVRYIEADEKGVPTKFKHEPCDTHANLALITVADFEVAALALISNLFNLKLDNQVNQLQEELKSF